MFSSTKKPDPVDIKPDSLTLQVLRDAYTGPAKVTLSAKHLKQIEKSHATVAKALADGKTTYGINTGFGLLARTKIASDQLEQLQKNLVLSHMAGVGKPLPDGVVRLVLILKILK